jgi:hypothetical protein
MKRYIDFIDDESEFRMYDHYFAELAQAVRENLP